MESLLNVLTTKVNIISAISLKRQFEISFIDKDRWQLYLEGLGNTLIVTFFALILGIVIGVIFSALKIKFPPMLDNTVNNFAKITTPLALLAIGGSFEFGKAIERMKPAVIATALKLVGWPLIFLPIAIKMGFRNEELMALVIMLGSPTTPSCYVMAKSMKSEGTLTSSVIVLTTLFSAFSITGIIFVLRSLGYL